MNEVPTVNSEELTDVDILATVPVTAPVKLPVLADTTHRCVAAPRAVPAVLDSGYEPVVFAMKFVVVKLAAFILPV